MPQNGLREEIAVTAGSRFDLSNGELSPEPRVYVLLMKQDDPRKCTAAKLAKMRLAKPLFRARQIPPRALILDPFAIDVLLPRDRAAVERYGLVAIDCSWERTDTAFGEHFRGLGRRLPTLLASNPVNYAKPNKLSSLEALAAGLYVLDFKELAGKLLNIFKWGNTFLTLNHEPLESYSKVETEQQMSEAEASFF